MKNVAVLLSGRGSNFLALSDAVEAGEISARLALVVSNRREAPGLEHARDRGYETVYLPSKGTDRESYGRLLLAELRKAAIDIVCLAGFMRVLGPELIGKFPNRILNIHPSLLPSFPGLDAQKQALEWGAKVTGCTVHFVDEQIDHGLIIIQHPVPILNGDTEETLSARILVYEHEIYPKALKWLCEDLCRIENRRVLVPEEA